MKAAMSSKVPRNLHRQKSVVTSSFPSCESIFNEQQCSLNTKMPLSQLSTFLASSQRNLGRKTQYLPGAADPSDGFPVVEQGLVIEK